jgi:hypothetical protein
MMFRRYGEIALDVSHIEVQQLMYFLRSAGEDMRLNYTKGHYGPHADNLRKAMRVMEGHFILGFGDGSKPIREAEPMELLASVHWVATRESLDAATDPAVAAELVGTWNARKQRMTGSDHVARAWSHLRDEHWLTSRNALGVR